MNRALILDGRHMLYRTSDAFSNLSTVVGDREIGCGGMYGFLAVAVKVHRRYRGTVYVAWEGDRRNNFRSALYPGYKKRGELNEDELAFILDMQEQEMRLKAMLRAVGVRQFEALNGEADDVMARLSKERFEAGEQVVVYTGDSDLRQLVKKGVTVVAPGRRSGDIVYDTSKSVKEKHGVYPFQLADLKALAGDKSDGIPGVRSIGDVTAAKLLEEYSNVKGAILGAARDGDNFPVAERFRKLLIENRRDILLFKKLTSLKYDVGMRAIKPVRSKKKVLAYFHLYRFQSLLNPSEMMDIMKMGE